jgi:hypothetical protein
MLVDGRLRPILRDQIMIPRALFHLDWDTYFVVFVGDVGGLGGSIFNLPRQCIYRWICRGFCCIDDF